MTSFTVQARKIKPRVLLDANVLVAGIGWPRFAYAVLQHAVKGDYQLELSPFVIAEARRHIQRLFPEFIEPFERFLEAGGYREIDTPTREELEQAGTLSRDINDIPVVLAAINAHVDVLVSHDKDITASDSPAHQYVRVMLPGTFLREYLGWTSEQLEAIRNRTWSDLSNE